MAIFLIGFFSPLDLATRQTKMWTHKLQMKFVCQITARIMTHDQETVSCAPDASFHTIFSPIFPPSSPHHPKPERKTIYCRHGGNLCQYQSVASQMPSRTYLIFSIHFIAACASTGEHNSKWLRWFLHALILLQPLGIARKSKNNGKRDETFGQWRDNRQYYSLELACMKMLRW